MAGVAGRVKKVIKEQGITQKEFARRICCTNSYVSKLLRGESGVSGATARVIEVEFGYSRGWILTGKGGGLEDWEGVRRSLQKEIEKMGIKKLDLLNRYVGMLLTKDSDGE